MASAKEKAWLEHYFQCGFNATEAARRAKYKNPEVMGCRKAKKFEKEISDRMADLVMDAEEALARISEMARGEWGKYIEENGTLDIKKLVADGKGYLVKKIRETRDGKEYEFYDAQGALRDIAKIHGKFVERHEIGEPGAFDPNNWKQKAQERLQHIADLGDSECADQDG
jgi:hypothetical protein